MSNKILCDDCIKKYKENPNMMVHKLCIKCQKAIKVEQICGGLRK